MARSPERRIRVALAALGTSQKSIFAVLRKLGVKEESDRCPIHQYLATKCEDLVDRIEVGALQVDIYSTNYNELNEDPITIQLPRAIRYFIRKFDTRAETHMEFRQP